MIKKNNEPKRDKVYSVALYLLALADEKNVKDINHKKLQKLVYYCQAMSLVQTGEELFDNNIEAWVHGAVVPDLYEELKGKDIRLLQSMVSEIKDQLEEDLTDEEKKIIKDTFKLYGNLRVEFLETLNHAEDPWRKTRGVLGENQPSNEIITTDAMKKYYTNDVRINQYKF